jgi:hypothetical protein
MRELTVQEMASTIVIIVQAYPQFVAPTMHAGIDLARALQGGDQAVTHDATLVATIADTYQQLGEAVTRAFERKI